MKVTAKEMTKINGSMEGQGDGVMRCVMERDLDILMAADSAPHEIFCGHQPNVKKITADMQTPRKGEEAIDAQ